MAEFLEDVRDVGGVKARHAIIGNAQLHAPGGVRFDEVDEFPGDGRRREKARERPQAVLGHQSLQEPADRRRQADVDRQHAELRVAVARLDVQVHVVHPHHLAVVDVNNLLVQNFVVEMQQALVRRVAANLRRRHGGLNLTDGNGLHLVVRNAKRALVRSAHQIGSHQQRVVGGIHAHVLQPAQIFAVHVISVGMLKFGKINHVAPLAGGRNAVCRPDFLCPENQRPRGVKLSTGQWVEFRKESTASQNLRVRALAPRDVKPSLSRAEPP